jgi:hypothetical protein
MLSILYGRVPYYTKHIVGFVILLLAAMGTLSIVSLSIAPPRPPYRVQHSGRMTDAVQTSREAPFLDLLRDYIVLANSVPNETTKYCGCAREGWGSGWGNTVRLVMSCLLYSVTAKRVLVLPPTAFKHLGDVTQEFLFPFDPWPKDVVLAKMTSHVFGNFEQFCCHNFQQTGALARVVYLEMGLWNAPFYGCIVGSEFNKFQYPHNWFSILFKWFFALSPTQTLRLATLQQHHNLADTSMLHIGVHLRTHNMQTFAPKMRGNVDWITLMADAVRELRYWRANNRAVNVFVVSISKETADEFSAILGPDYTITSIHSTGNKQDVYDTSAFDSIMLLSKCDLVVGTEMSSFSALAVGIGGREPQVTCVAGGFCYRNLRIEPAQGFPRKVCGNHQLSVDNFSGWYLEFLFKRNEKKLQEWNDALYKY